MPRWHFSQQKLDPERTAKVSGRDLRVSYKDAVEVCNAIRGLKLSEAKKYLEDVVGLKRPIPFRRFTGKQAHHEGAGGWPVVRWPVKAAREVLKLLEGMEANAEFKGLELDRLRIMHASACKGAKVRRYISRAFRRSTPRFQQLVHVEIAVEEG